MTPRLDLTPATIEALSQALEKAGLASLKLSQSDLQLEITRRGKTHKLSQEDLIAPLSGRFVALHPDSVCDDKKLNDQDFIIENSQIAGFIRNGDILSAIKGQLPAKVSLPDDGTLFGFADIISRGEAA